MQSLHMSINRGHPVRKYRSETKKARLEAVLRMRVWTVNG